MCNSTAALKLAKSLLVLGIGTWMMAGGSVSAQTLDSAHSVAASFASSSEPSVMYSGVRMVGGLFLCLGIFAVGVRFLRRWNTSAQASSRRRIEILERVQLSSKASLLLIAVDNREYLITRGSETVQILPAQSGSAEIFEESLHQVSAEAEAYNA